jgi:methionyl aminopeptidase
MPEKAYDLKSGEQIDKMRLPGKAVYEVLQRCREVCKAGVTTGQIDAEAEKMMANWPGATALFKGYPAPSRSVAPFPAVTCISVNEQVVHGIPGDRVIQEGDLVSVDFGIRIDGWCGDSATTILVGEVRPKWRKLCEVTEHVLEIAIEQIQPGRKWSHVARRMQDYAERSGMSVIKNFVGHGIGKELHEDPKVPNYVSPELQRHDIDLEPGMVLAIEPMCCLGSDRVKTLEDGWTVATSDNKPAAHYEHTVAVTESGCEILTTG